MSEICPCDDSKKYSECCARVHGDQSLAQTPEQLMRARYSAFAKGNIHFLEQSLHPDNRDEFDADSAKQWADASDWLGLEVLDHDEQNGEVEFRAHYNDGTGPQCHHERSEFRKKEGLWYFYQGQAIVPKRVGRNEPCPCGSGRKYKKCCLINS